MNKKFLLFCSGVMLSTSLWAQTKTVTGKVTNASDGGTMPNVTVSIKGKAVSTQTKPDGSFTINAEPGDILIFRAVGSQERQQLVGANATINVALSGSEQALDEVVVTAMGIKKEKKALGYAVQDIKSDELMKNKTANVVNSLAGKIAGVNVTQSSGSAGAGAQIILRGGTSLERDNQPLFVVDGVIYDNSTIIGGNSAFDGATATSSSNSNRVMDINPEDIDNVSVLKGPAAAALYGSRAAAGAIVITTKKGQEGRTEIGFSSRFSDNWANRLPEQQGKYKRGYYNDAGKLDTYTTQSWGEEFGPNDVVYNNIKDFFQHSTVFDNTVNLSGGNKNGSFYLSGSRFDQKGIVPSTKFNKTTFRFNGDQKFGKLTVGANVAYSLANTDKTLTSAGLWGSGGTGAMESLYGWSRSDDMKKYLNDDGTKYRMFEGRQQLEDDIENPYWTINRNKLGDNTERITGNINANLPIFDWWSLSYRVGMDSYLTKNSTRIARGGAIKKIWQDGMLSESDLKFNYWSSNLMSNFNKKVGDFDLGALVGFFSEQTKTTNNRRIGYGFAVEDFYSFENTDDAHKQFTVTHANRRLYGVYGELRASYKNILFLNATGRNDWTSTLPVANRSYFYPSVGGSFVFSELLKDNRPEWLDFGKLRASWARVGKDALPYVTNTYLWKPVEYLGGIVGSGNNWQKGNPILKPETTSSFEVGAELRFFKGRLGIDYAYYTNNSYNQILSPRMAQSTGYIFVSVNAGDIYNKGMELSLTGKPIVKKDFVWESTLNLSKNRGTVDNLIAGVDILYVTDVQVGNAKAASFNGGNFMAISGSKWSRTADGKLILDAKTGMPTSDNQVTYEIGNREPKLLGGFNNSLTYKNFNLSFLFDFRIGGDIYNGTEYAMTLAGLSKRTEDRDKLVIEGAVLKDGTSDVYEDKTFTFMADQMYPFNGKSTSGKKIIQDYWGDYYMRESANFMTKTNWLRLRNISVSYNFSDGVLKNAGVSKVVKGLTATLTGTNLWLLTNYKGLDPEASAAGSGVVGSSSVGIDYNGVPSTAGVMFGLNFRF